MFDWIDTNETSNVSSKRRNDIEILSTWWNLTFLKTNDTTNSFRFDVLWLKIKLNFVNRFIDKKLRYSWICRWFSMTSKNFWIIFLNLILSMIHSIEKFDDFVDDEIAKFRIWTRTTIDLKITVTMKLTIWRIVSNRYLAYWWFETRNFCRAKTIKMTFWNKKSIVKLTNVKMTINWLIVNVFLKL